MMMAFQKLIVPVWVIFMARLDPMTSFSQTLQTSVHGRTGRLVATLGGNAAAEPPKLMRKKSGGLLVLYEAKKEGSNDNDDKEKELTTTTTATKQSLQEKMKNWQASEEEIKAASLGGVVPQPRERSDSFDVGLYVAFPFMIIACLLLLAFPFFADKIDVSSVGPPPMS